MGGPPTARLGTVWERRRLRTAFAIGVAVALVAGAIAVLFARGTPALAPALVVAAAAGVGAHFAVAARVRRRRRILARPFPPEWEAVLQRDVVFYRALDADGKRRFRRELRIFLGEKRITGIRTDVDTTTLVLTGASAVIPIFGFPEWEWDQISEVLIYPGRFDQEFGFGESAHGGPPRNTLGMVGTGALNRVMILSKPDLVAGFRNAGDKRNVGVHEFAHLVDKSDGTIDGLPGVGLDRASIGPWVDLVRRKMAEIERGDSDIDPYALTNEAEFFAVATEYLFERPGIMERKHPELFAMMQRVFRQDFGDRVGAMRRELAAGRPRFGRNSPCPCGSGTKYKKCCLRKARKRG